MHKRVLVTGLVVLVAVNILWAWILRRSTPLVGAAVYAVVAFQVIRRDEYRAAFLVGAIGASLHLFEFLRGGGRSTWLDMVLAIVNIALPALVACVGLMAWRHQLSNAAREDQSRCRGHPISRSIGRAAPAVQLGRQFRFEFRIETSADGFVKAYRYPF